MYEFDGVLQGYNMTGPLVVDQVDHDRQGGGFAVAGGTGDQDQAAAVAGERCHYIRQAQPFDGGDLMADNAEGQSGIALVAIYIDAKIGQTIELIGSVYLPAVLVFL